MTTLLRMRFLGNSEDDREFESRDAGVAAFEEMKKLAAELDLVELRLESDSGRKLRSWTRRGFA